MNETVYDIWLSLALGPKGGYKGLFEVFSGAEEVYGASADALIYAGVTPRELSALSDKRLQEALRVAAYCERTGTEILVRGKPGYPGILDCCEFPPYLLYVKGRLPAFDVLPGIGVVGTRNMTSYGMENAYRISYELAAAGAVIVSGMARGIDGIAAAGALEAGGTTVAVIGCGPDTVYPPEHGRLMEEISRTGAVVSEFPPASPPDSYHFPLRNRIISGLSRGLLVVEAGGKSGAMLTAEEAKNQGKDLFAVPGRIGDAMSEGPNRLIREGARAVFGAEDILSFYADRYPFSEDAYARATACSAFCASVPERWGVRPARDSVSCGTAAAKTLAPGRKDLPEDPKLRAFFEKMPAGKPISPDWFVSLGYRADEAVATLTLLEITGFVRSIPGGMFTK